MSKRMRGFALLLIIALSGALVPFTQVLAADGTALLTPAYQNVEVGQTANVAFRVENIDQLYGYQVDISFNPAVVEVVDADPTKAGVQVTLGTFLQADFVQENDANNGTGVITCVVSQLSPTSAVSGSGDLLTITFHAKAQGISDIGFADLKLAKSNGIEITVNQQSAQVGVGNVNQPTATPTATSTTVPTATATPTTAPGATATPTATPAPGQTVIYVVRTGDTLYSIARSFGVSVASIAQLNSISNTGYIQVGQRLIIPRSGSSTPVPSTPQPSPFVYIVQWRDTLYSIARRYGTTVEAIAMENHIANPSRIYVGQRLVISTGSSTPPAPGQMHIVQRGETLYSIARRYNTTYWAIAVANHLSNPNVIYAGQHLVIP